MLLSGYTGQFSLGHAAFLGGRRLHRGACSQAAGVPFSAGAGRAALLSAAVGVVVGVPALRVKGIYLAIATLAFGFIVEEVVRALGERDRRQCRHAREGDRDCSAGTLSSERGLLLVCLAVAVLCTLRDLNLLRSPTGRAFVAIRDSEVSAQSMGIHLARYKTLSFALSAALAGVGGALYAHKLSFISPEQFSILQSIDLLLHGGHRRPRLACTARSWARSSSSRMPQVIALGKDWLPDAIAQAPGCRRWCSALVLIVFVHLRAATGCTAAG